jgi:hypothetical protein
MLRRLLIAILLIPAASSAQQWKLIAPMNHARSELWGTLLDDGTILFSVGRSGPNSIEPTSEIYDPATNTWVSTGGIQMPRIAVWPVKLHNGNVYISGGLTNLTSIAGTTTAELYSTTSKSWTYTSQLLIQRDEVSAIVLPNGKVLTVCGNNASNNSWPVECELYDPSTLSQTFTGSILQGQVGGPLFLDTFSNKVIMISDHVNGAYGTWYSATEEYDIASGTWNIVANSSSPHAVGSQQALQLPNGEILAPSGGSGPVSATSPGGAATPLIEAYNPQSHSWRIIGNIRIPRYLGSSVYIGDDSVIVIGGIDASTGLSLDDCEIINLKTGAVSAGPKLNVSRAFHYMQVIKTRDPSDVCTEITRIYVFGGASSFGSGQTDLFGNSLSSCEMIEFRHSAPNTLSLPQPMTVNGTVCSGIDTSVTISAITCNTLRIDSVSLEGFSNSLVTTKLPDTLNNGVQKTFQLSFHSTTAGTSQGNIRIFYNIGGSEIDTTIPITTTLQASTRGTIRSIVHDIMDAGDTVLIPIYLASNSGDRAQSFQLNAHFNTDLLSPIDPEFGGTLTRNTVVWDQNQISGGINFFVQQPFSISTSMPLVILKFKTYVTKEQCTSFVIDNLQISFDSTGGKTDPCPLAVLGDSATICRANACGDNTLREYLRTGNVPTLQAYYNIGDDKIIIEDPIRDPHQIEILNMLGEVLKRISSTGGKYIISGEGITTGLYIIRSTYNLRTYWQKISIIK